MKSIRKLRMKQLNALSRARQWRGNFEMVRRAVKEAALAFPISDIQRYNLQMKFGHSAVEELRAVAEKVRP